MRRISRRLAPLKSHSYQKEVVGRSRGLRPSAGRDDFRRRPRRKLAAVPKEITITTLTIAVAAY